jgi:low affinity Fe/Cu permease
MHVRIDPATYWTWPSRKREWKGAAITKKIETRVPATKTAAHPMISVHHAEKQANSRRPKSSAASIAMQRKAAISCSCHDLEENVSARLEGAPVA